MRLIHLVEGPVGAGKSTFAAGLASRIGGVHIALDDWFAALFSPDRPDAGVMSWYAPRKDRLVRHIWAHAQVLLRAGVTPILELGLVRAAGRRAFYEQARLADVRLEVHVLEASRETRRERVARRNVERGPTFSMVVPEPIFEYASDAWQPPDAMEIEAQAIHLVRTDDPGTVN